MVLSSRIDLRERVNSRSSFRRTIPSSGGEIDHIQWPYLDKGTGSLASTFSRNNTSPVPCHPAIVTRRAAWWLETRSASAKDLRHTESALD